MDYIINNENIKRTITLFFCMLLAVGLKAQIIITGIMYDPAGFDAQTDGYEEGTIHKGGYEYVQLRATRDINFATEKYSVVFCRNNNGTTAATLEKGWAAGGNRTIKVNLTTGSVTKGDFFYVGGAEKVIGGYRGTGAGLMLSTDMSSSKWYPLTYAVVTNQDGTKGPNTADGSIDVGSSFDEDGTPYYGKSTNSLLHNAADQPSGVGVFAGTNVTKDTYPIDAVFYCGTGTNGTTTIDASTGISYVYNSTNDWGYKMPDNDWYSSSLLFGQGTNTTAMVRYTTTDQSYFLKLGGDYNTQTEAWDVKRSATYVQVADKSKTTLATFQIGNAATIENTTGTTTLPVELISFDAKSNNGRVKLTWSTASENNNAYFTVLRSTDGVTFNQIGEIAGRGTTNTLQQYNFTDYTPAVGTNYYQLRQVDLDLKSTLSKIVFINALFSDNIFKVWYSNGYINISFENRENHSEEIADITISDITGRKKASFKTNIVPTSNNLSLGVSLVPGVYMVTLSSGQVKYTAKTLIVGK